MIRDVFLTISLIGAIHLIKWIYLKTTKSLPASVSPKVGIDGPRGKETSLLVIFLTVLLSGCGSSDPDPTYIEEVPSWELTALTNTTSTFESVAEASPNKSCNHDDVYLAGISWSIVNGSPYDLATQDILEVNENCTFRSYACGSLGYIIEGGLAPFRGLVTVKILGHLFPKPGCYRLGTHLCGYVEDGAGEIRLDCQWIDPLKEQWLP